MRLGSIGARLTLWYVGIMALALLAFGAGMWIALNHSLYHAIDESLRDRVEGIRQFIEVQSDWQALEGMQEEFREHSVLGPGGDLFQVADPDGNWLYRSDPLYDEHVPVYETAELGEDPRFENLTIQGTRLRFLAQRVQIQRRPYVVQVAAPLGELERGLDEFVLALMAALPLTLLVASAGGYWISRRALRPVDEITETARTISAENLSRRLPDPRSRDELERLSHTMNNMMERLESAFKRIARFTADASHELRTPIAVMRTTADVALRGSSEPAEQHEALEQIVAELERMSQLVDNLLLVARADSGEAELSRAPIDLVEAVREASAQAVVLARAKGVQYELSLPDKVVRVCGDRQALRRLFLILIDNAVKYTAAGGRIGVTLKDGDGATSVAIEDSGIGIPEEEVPYIFERFYRVDEARSREKGGAGLGLAIAHWIVEAHGGRLLVESSAGEGSVFTVRLPTQ